VLYVITGGSASGKSEYAETVAVYEHTKHFPKGMLYYVASMYPYDQECEQKILRHKKMRRGKGFHTLEQYVHNTRTEAGDSDVFLIECMSNLLANEMYLEEGICARYGKEAREQIPDEICHSIEQLEKQAGSVIVVTNEVFSDGRQYDLETNDYIRLLGEINQKLAKRADAVAEVVCSIPICQKGELPC
jgi:adenosylcobinamide kinase/adenosylcobinamide-phosphate guanylyltransferase